MRNIPTKHPGDQLTSAEFNDIPDELENAITNTGQTLSSLDLYQSSKAMSVYAAGGDFYTDSGAADAYVLSVVGSKQSPPTYFVGMRCRFIPGNTNTGASTCNVASLGVKNIKTVAGNDPVAGEIIQNRAVEIFYDGTNLILIDTAAYTIPFSDLLALVSNNADPTKLLKFDLNNMTTSTTSTISVDDTGIDFATNKSIAANGYYKLPGGFIIQWGTTSSLSEGVTTISFPITFPTAPLSIQLTLTGWSGTLGTGAGLMGTDKATWTTTQFDIDNRVDSAPETAIFSWIAIGY